MPSPAAAVRRVDREEDEDAWEGVARMVLEGASVREGPPAAG